MAREDPFDAAQSGFPLTDPKRESLTEPAHDQVISAPKDEKKKRKLGPEVAETELKKRIERADTCWVLDVTTDDIQRTTKELATDCFIPKSSVVMNMAMNSTIKEEGDVYKQDKNQEEITLAAEVEERLREREREDPELVEIVQPIKETIDDTREFLIRNSANNTPIPRGYTGKITGAYKLMSRDGNSAAGVVHKELEAVSYKRNKVLKKIRRSIRNTILEEPAQEMRSLPNISTKSTTTGVTAGKDGARKSIRKQAKDAQTELKGLHCERTSALEALKRRNEQNEITELGVDQEEDLDVNSLEENDGKQHPRGEPLHWQDLLKEDMKVNIPDGVEV
ncbi:uncharacterized protein J4E88_002570 [Alternaria novae-zelandiae]|uniref:uncharacterized protein n=1 Tax=Alternaria novae-zelandiae TaxID=430562 RepID=UPI0020C300B8|nr:uncharacterized protein J4E88_002570 [Alternaria novae-zelandiae]KAI4689220.1 hypothetical protein J4E88_002570 [Alternaria novae-zelandiae]